jgi:hypothetical protein
MNSHLIRDQNGEPVRELRTRDGQGRFCRPWYAYIWKTDTDRLADEIVAAAVQWAGGDLGRLDDAARFLAQTPLLEGSPA